MINYDAIDWLHNDAALLVRQYEKTGEINPETAMSLAQTVFEYFQLEDYYDRSDKAWDEIHEKEVSAYETDPALRKLFSLASLS